MQGHVLIIVAGLSFVVSLPAHAGEPAAVPQAITPFALAPESVLPVHDGRDAYTPCAAYLKDSYIVIWQSGRLAPGDLREGYKFNGDLVGCRIDKGGKAVDAQPFVVCEATDLQERPRAAVNKDVALLVWQDLRPSAGSGQATGKDWDVYAARVTAEGKVLDPDGFLVSGGAHNQASPRVTWDGKTFVVVWQDYRNGQRYAVYAARVSGEGKVLDAEGIKVSSSGQSCYDPSIASAGDGRSFIFWSCYNYGVFQGHNPRAEALFLTDGKPSEVVYDPDPKKTGEDEMGKDQPGGGNTPTFMTAGKGVYLVAWQNEHPAGRGNGDTKINAYVFDAQGKRAARFTLAGSPHRVLNADVVWDGSAFVAAWTELRTKDDRRYPAYEHVFASRLAHDGKPASPYQLLAGCSSPPPNWSYPGGQRGGISAKDREAPAMNACAATDGAGTTLIAYEKHPEKPETPIMIGFRMLTAK